MVIIFLIFLTSCTDIGHQVDAVAFTNTFRRVKYIDNYDGDTITVTIRGLPPVFGHKIPVRIKHIDTAEMNGKTDCEHSMAILAKRQVHTLLHKALRIDLEKTGRGSFFRILADMRIRGMRGSYLLSDYLLDAGYAVAYEGGSKPATDWCEQQKIMLEKQ